MKHTSKIVSGLLSALMILSVMPVSGSETGRREVIVTNTDELIAALADAAAGDEIILREGVYQNDTYLGEWSAFHAIASGTQEQPIVIRSEDPEHPATISGVTQDNKVALKIVGSYWEIRDLIVCEAQKGIFLQQSEHSIISGCEVYNVGSEAIHIIDNSSYNLVENCFVHDAGTLYPQYGEGVYIGSSQHTEGYGYDCHYNTVRGCRLGPNIAADHVDIKEFTIGNVVEECIFDGTGIKGENGGNSFVEVKGNNCVIRNNLGYRNGNEIIEYAFDANVQVDGWAQNNKVYDNTLYMDISDCMIFKEWNCTTEVFRNTTYPEGLNCSGNKTLQVQGYALTGDASEDGMVDAYDVRQLQNFLLDRDVVHLSGDNADLTDDGVLNGFDLALLKRKHLSGEKEEPDISVSFTKEAAGKWRMCNGLGGRSLTFILQGEAGNMINMGWGYWNPNDTNPETGAAGLWNQISLGSFILDENGYAEITVELPVDVTSVALQVYGYQNDTEKLDKDAVVLVSATTR
ncbi:MAG: right-handed parallel beta-helix repeat-containing protein [Oscillospiraceae bacterium]|nr:right-handed parallel beta-helix repeat-containing protein [Oscillospiraceae bacterium]